MKRILSLILIAVFALSFSLCANAESNVDVSMAIEYEYVNDTVKITAKFNDIKAKEGIVLADYCINYNKESLELVEHRTIYPKDWEEYTETEMVESFFSIGEDKKFHWSVLAIPVGIGCKGDDELGVYLEFKVLNKEDTSIELEYYNILTEYIYGGKSKLYPVSGNSATIDIDFDEPSTPVIEKSDVSVEVDESIFITEESVVNGETESSSDQPTIQQPNGKVSMPDVVQSNSNIDSQNNDSSSWILWTLVGVGVLAIVIVILFVVNSKRGKK